MKNKLNKSNSLSNVLYATCFFFAALPFLAMAGEKDYTTQDTWEGGMQSGKGNYLANCSACHGPEGKGDGVMAESLDIKPRNIANKSAMSARTDEYLIKVIKQGGPSVGLSENMPLWGTTFSDEEIQKIVKYIRAEICKCKYTGK